VYWLFAWSADVSWNSMRWRSPLDLEFRIAEDGREQGSVLGALFASIEPPLPSIGVITAGGIARTYPGPIVDVMGLNNSLIGHFDGDRVGTKNNAAFERDAFFQVEPDILLAAPPGPHHPKAWLKGLDQDPRFTDHWRYGTLFHDDAPELSLDVFVRDSLIERLQTQASVQFRETLSWAETRAQTPDSQRLGD
jgi:hypothetical protein